MVEISVAQQQAQKIECGALTTARWGIHRCMMPNSEFVCALGFLRNRWRCRFLNVNGVFVREHYQHVLIMSGRLFFRWMSAEKFEVYEFHEEAIRRGKINAKGIKCGSYWYLIQV